MAAVLTDVSSFDADVTVPEDGDARNAASVRAAFQKLANRTRWLFNQLAGFSLGAGQFDYAAPQVVTRVIPLDKFRVDSVHTGTLTCNTLAPSLVHSANSGTMVAGINEFLVDGATITGAALKCHPGAARAGANRVNITLVTVTAAGVVATPAVALDNTTAGDQTIPLTATEIVTLATKAYSLYVQAGSDNAANPDLFESLTITMSVPGLRA